MDVVFEVFRISGSVIYHVLKCTVIAQESNLTGIVVLIPSAMAFEETDVTTTVVSLGMQHNRLQVQLGVVIQFYKFVNLLHRLVPRRYDQVTTGEFFFVVVNDVLD